MWNHVKGESLMLNVRLIKCTAIGLCLLAGLTQAGNDASLPEGYLGHSREERTYDVRSVTPPLITAFAAPDSAMRGLAFDGQYLWAANSGDGNSMFGPKIYRLDPDSGTVLNSYSGLSNHPCGLAWDGQYLWHSTYVGGIIYQLDTMGLTIVRSFLAPTTHPFDLAWDGNYLYAVKGNQPYVSVIDTASGAELDSIEATYSSPNVRPFGLAFLGRSAPQLLTCDGNYGSNLVNSWSFNASAWVDQWAGEPTLYPSGLAYDSVSERLWLSCYDLDSIYVYDMSQVGITDNDAEIVFVTRLDARPNPFNSSAEIRYQMTDDSPECEIGIYDITGRLVVNLSERISVIGHQLSVKWNGCNMYGQQVPPGVYFVRLQGEAASVKLVKLK